MGRRWGEKSETMDDVCSQKNFTAEIRPALRSKFERALHVALPGKKKK